MNGEKYMKYVSESNDNVCNTWQESNELLICIIVFSYLKLNKGIGSAKKVNACIGKIFQSKNPKFHFIDEIKCEKLIDKLNLSVVGMLK